VISLATDPHSPIRIWPGARFSREKANRFRRKLAHFGQKIDAAGQNRRPLESH
jgi:hypothetical protein